MFISEKDVAAFPFVCPPACLIRVCGSKQQNNCWFLKIMSYHCHVGGYEWHVCAHAHKIHLSSWRCEWNTSNHKSDLEGSSVLCANILACSRDDGTDVVWCACILTMCVHVFVCLWSSCLLWILNRKIRKKKNAGKGKRQINMAKK